MNKQLVATALLLSFATSMHATKPAEKSQMKLNKSTEKLSVSSSEKQPEDSKQEKKQPDLQAILEAQQQTNAFLEKIVKNQKRQSKFRQEQLTLWKEQWKFYEKQDIFNTYFFYRLSKKDVPVALEKQCKQMLNKKYTNGPVIWQ